jgi:hypothetical protein
MPEQIAESLDAGEVAGPFHASVPAQPGPVDSPLDRDKTGVTWLRMPTRLAFPSISQAVGRPRLTGRGAIVALFALFLVASVLSDWTGLGVLTGLGYLVGCTLAPLYVRDRALLQVVVVPPALFLSIVLIIQVLTAQGTGKHGMVLSVVEGTLLTLAATAPWLLAGTAASVGIALRRGLMGPVRQIWGELRGDLRALIGRVA